MTLKSLIKHTTERGFGNFEKCEGLILGRKWLCVQFGGKKQVFLLNSLLYKYEIINV